nr:PREDICTED: solute carrier family 40 member 1-like isoform X1 [Latimeria chalumnae]|eukprot:XP_006006098.2 PREDICTED: solute carrier family 40 member 1-like isoform X1 [Latimeria chalumnae]
MYLGHVLSTWGDRMWHFAVSLFLVELYGNNLLLTAIFGLAKSSFLIFCGALIGNWVDTNLRLKVVQVALVIQNLSVALCAVVLMVLLIYKAQISSLWGGWLTVPCYALVIIIGVIAELASTAMSISIQRDWIVVVAGGSGKLAGMNSTIRQIDLFSKLLSPIAVGQIMAFISSKIGCAFIAGWNVFSMGVEYWLFHKVYKMIPALAKKNVRRQKLQGQISDEAKRESITSAAAVLEGGPTITNHDIKKKEVDDDESVNILLHPVKILHDGWLAYYKQPIFLAAVGLAFLYMTVLGFDGITTGYAYSQGINSSVLSIMVALSALTGLLGTVFFTVMRKYCGLIRTGYFSSIAQTSCLLLCVLSAFAPGSPLDLNKSCYSYESDKPKPSEAFAFPTTNMFNHTATLGSLLFHNITPFVPNGTKDPTKNVTVSTEKQKNILQ